MGTAIQSAIEELDQLPDHRHFGRVDSVLGLVVEVAGLEQSLSVGGRCRVSARDGSTVTCEAIGFRKGHAALMPFGTLEGVGLGCKAEVAAAEPVLRPTDAWLGRVFNALGEPIDGKGPLPTGPLGYRLRAVPPPHARKRVGEKMDLGVRALNTFLTCCRGQRMGIFSGSGVGKSVLRSMVARLLERAGPGTDGGSITGLFTVLVEGDDHNELIPEARKIQMRWPGRPLCGTGRASGANGTLRERYRRDTPCGCRSDLRCRLRCGSRASPKRHQ